MKPACRMNCASSKVRRTWPARLKLSGRHADHIASKSRPESAGSHLAQRKWAHISIRTSVIRITSSLKLWKIPHFDACSQIKASAMTWQDSLLKYGFLVDFR